jgi:hypothetical protein
VIDRRLALIGPAALAACAGAEPPLPGYLFSLTVWGSGESIEFLLLNVADHPIRVIQALPGAVRVEVADGAGASLTGGFVPLFSDAPAPDLSPARARRLPSQKALRAKLSAAGIARALAGRVSLDPAQTYRIGFEVDAPVVGPDGTVLMAHVRTRSLCDLSFRDGRPQMACRSPYSPGAGP